MESTNEIDVIESTLFVNRPVAIALHEVLDVTSETVRDFSQSCHPESLRYLRKANLIGFRWWNPQIDDSRYYGMCAVVERETQGVTRFTNFKEDV